MSDAQGTYPAPGASSLSGKAKGFYSQHKSTIKKVVVAVLCVLLLIFIVSTITASVQLDDCKKGRFHPGGNLSTGSNNPLWHMQSGHSGAGGSMDSWRPEGSSHPLAASAEGPDTHGIPLWFDPLKCGQQSGKAQEEAKFAQDMGGGSSALSDAALNGVLHGGN